jgi:4-amino-4-deoxy-L-arabinose transferase-like glycosyltransferase
MKQPLHYNPYPRLAPTLAILILLAYSFGLTHPLFIPDEGRYAEVAREMFTGHDFIIPTLNSIPFLDKPILMYWLTSASYAIFGVKIWSARLVTMALGLWGIYFAYIIGRDCFSVRVGLVTASILATQPLYIILSHYVNMDLAVAHFMNISLGLYFRSLTRQKKPYDIFFAYLAISLAFLSKGLIGIAIPGLIVGTFWLLQPMKKKYWRHFKPWLGLTIILACILPWMLWAQAKNPQFLSHFFILNQLQRFTGSHFNNVLPWWFFWPLTLTFFFHWNCLFIPMLKSSIQQPWQVQEKQKFQFLWLWAIWPLAFFSIPPAKLIGYIGPVFFPLCLLLARYIDSIWKNPVWLSAIAKNFLWLLAAGLSLFYIATLSKLPTIAISYRYTLIFLLSIPWWIQAYCCQWRAYFKRGWPLILLFISTSLSQWCLLSTSLPYLHHNHAADIIKLKKYLRPETQVLIYKNFFHDIPFYLDRPITVVDNWGTSTEDNWRRDLWSQGQFSPTSPLWSIQKWQKNWAVNNRERILLLPQHRLASIQKMVHPLYKLYAFNIDHTPWLALSNRKAPQRMYHKLQ